MAHVVSSVRPEGARIDLTWSGVERSNGAAVDSRGVVGQLAVGHRQVTSRAQAESSAVLQRRRTAQRYVSVLVGVRVETGMSRFPSLVRTLPLPSA